MAGLYVILVDNVLLLLIVQVHVVVSSFLFGCLCVLLLPLIVFKG